MGIFILGIIAVGIALIYVGSRRSHQGGATGENNRSDRRANLGVTDSGIASEYADTSTPEDTGLGNDLAEQHEGQPPQADSAAVKILQDDTENAAFIDALTALSGGRPGAIDDLLAPFEAYQAANSDSADPNIGRSDGEIAEKASLAYVYGYLAKALQTGGDLESAEKLQRAAIALNEELGDRESMAANYSNLGVVLKGQGALNDAEFMIRNALALHEKLGLRANMAANFDSLGTVFDARGDLDNAAEMYREALALTDALDDRVGMARQLSSLGTVYSKQRDVDRAEEAYRKALALREELSDKEGMARDLGNLGNVFLLRRDTESAKEMYHRSLILDEEVGNKKGMATQYSNLANVFMMRENDDEACRYRRISHDLFLEIGAHDEAKVIAGYMAEAGCPPE